MRVLVKYKYGVNGVLKNGMATVDIEGYSNQDFEEMEDAKIDGIIKPILAKKFGHIDTKILSVMAHHR